MHRQHSTLQTLTETIARAEQVLITLQTTETVKVDIDGKIAMTDNNYNNQILVQQAARRVSERAPQSSGKWPYRICANVPSRVSQTVSTGESPCESARKLPPRESLVSECPARLCPEIIEEDFL